MAKRGEKRSRAIRSFLSERQVAYLLTGVGVRGDATLYFWKIDDEKILAAWKTVGPDLVAEHVRKFPGTRPWGWWKFDAPERRLRVGGTGTERREVFKGWKGALDFGVPKNVLNWINERDVSIYLRQGRIVGKAFDENDPPTFESEATFLRRLGLFLKGEEKRIPAAAFEPEAITLKEDAP